MLKILFKKILDLDHDQISTKIEWFVARLPVELPLCCSSKVYFKII